MKLIIHSGFPKCASSSIQATLSASPEIALGPSSSLRYLCLRHWGVLHGDQLIQRSKERLFGYVASTPAKILCNYQQHVTTRVTSALSVLGADDIAIFSCEGWIDQLEYLDKLRFVSDFGDQVTFVVLVRPPVGWINSAFWQWGAWTGVDQSTWVVKRGQPQARWASRLEKIKEVFPDASIKVIPITQGLDASKAFFSVLGLDPQVLNNLKLVRHNTSLPLEILHLYLRFPELRPSPHHSEIDFLISRAVSAHTSKLLTRSAWCMNPEEVAKVIRNLAAEYDKLIKYFLDEEASGLISLDPLWTDPNAYKSKEYVSIDSLRQSPAFASLQAESMIRDLVLAIGDQALKVDKSIHVG